jgi:predicted RNA-binding protein
VDGGKLVMKSLFGEKKELNATILEIDFTASVLKLEVVRDGLTVD